jgi:DNA-directed RNA polymerase II subunit RPB1
MAVCKVENPTVVDMEGTPLKGGINDLRMGTVDKTLACETCKSNFTDCPGHPGYIELAKPMYHVGFVEVCRKILRCICFNCSKLLAPKDKKYKEIMKVKSNKKRQALMFNLCKSVKVCKMNPKENVSEILIIIE